MLAGLAGRASFARIVRAMLERSDAAHAYLQVEADNDPALALYGRLGFTESHRYRHRVAPSP
ncbi:MAG TPA: hypothetical protein VG223_10025 [Solirubrobacteraceae bacterium]|nr:hypothetical protein [Solirubrobacteraceae bacterium]